jgi:CheY-like chemotaxis protein
MLAYAGRASFRVERLDLNRSIREMANLVAVSLPKKVTLECELAPEPLYVQGDPAQISQVVMNLVTNAAQAIGQDLGAVTLTTSSSVSGTGAAKAVLRVRDTGCGMTPEALERIFDPYYTTKDGGRGLGLAAVMGIVRGLDGTLDVASAPGKGTTFRLTFPLDSTPGVEELGAAPPSSARRGEGTILVVDDEDAVRSFTRRALERSGFKVLEARDGLEALAVYGREGSRVDAVVLDMSMPGMGGQEVFAQLRASNEALPVLFTSGYDPSDAAGTLLKEPHVRFLQKPYRTSALGEELQRLLATAVRV